jgi:hypothetical protein
MKENEMLGNGWAMMERLQRAYGPDKPLFEKTWELPDVEKIR